MPRLLLCTLMMVVSVVAIRAQKTGPPDPGGQATVEPKSNKIGGKPDIQRPLPFKSGELLSYDVGFSKFIFSGSIGQLKFRVSSAPEDRALDPKKSADPPTGRGPTQPAAASGPGQIQFTAEAVSKGFFTWLFGVKVSDRFSSEVSADDLGLLTSVRSIEEGTVRKEQKSVVDREAGRVTVTETDPNNKSAQPRIKKSPSPAWVQDFLSAIYFLRTQKLEEGRTITVPISDVGQVYNIDLVVGKREEVEVDAGKFKAILVDVKMFDGRYVKRSGELLVWITDDGLRLPVRAKLKTSGVTVNIGLASRQMLVDPPARSNYRGTVERGESDTRHLPASRR